MQALFSATLFVSAGLLFVVQPMFAKMVLPLLGGTPAVWNTCMVFYQAALLGGYIYAHLGARWLGARRQAVVHLALMLLPWLVLPIGISQSWRPPAESNPIPALLLLLATAVGLPFFIVSASAPMFQAWFARTGSPAAKDPYFLYAASNLGSLLALLGYPFVIEPHLTLRQQAVYWAVGYGLLMVLTVGCAVVLWRSRATAAETPSPASTEPADEPLSWAKRLRWVALAFVPSSLLLGVTMHISIDLAAVPLLWIVPLTLYLLTFVLVFARWQVLPHSWMVRIQPLLLLPVAVVFFDSTRWFWTMVGLHLAAFFVTAMVCHGELARTRPQASRLTEFYLWMSLGGVLGGFFNAIVAPTVFPWIGDWIWTLLNWTGGSALGRMLEKVLSPYVFYMILEYPLMIAVACLLRPPLALKIDTRVRRWIVFGVPTAIVAAAMIFMLVLQWKKIPLSHRWEWTLHGWEITLTPHTVVLTLMALITLVFMARPFWFAVGVSLVLMVGFWIADPFENVIYMKRSFFGVIRVSYDRHRKQVRLLHGSTTHGVQLVDPDPDRRNRPQSYYFPTGPLGDIFFGSANQGRRTHVAVIGLGTGSVAGYSKYNEHHPEPGKTRWITGPRITYFEIDHHVLGIATDRRLFTYVSDCKELYHVDLDVMLGDARLRLNDVDDQIFDLIVVDAFSSDAIPIHLLTREAMQLYFRKLKPDGVLAVHVSNRYLDLEPLVARIAKEEGLVCRGRRDNEPDEEAESEGRYASDWVAVARNEEALGDLRVAPEWRRIRIPRDTPCWTDDFSNILAAIRER